LTSLNQSSTLVAAGQAAVAGHVSRDHRGRGEEARTKERGVNDSQVDRAPVGTGEDPPTWWQRRTVGLDDRYWRLWGAVASSNLGDGLVSLAFPWLASLLTRDPMAIAGVALATRMPWLLFSLQAGVLGDRLDRRRLMVSANTVRALVAATTTAAVAFDAMSLPALYVAAFLLGMCEVVFDNTSQAILPALVARDRLDRANGTIIGAQMVIAEFVARPLSGAVIGVMLSLPFAIDAVTAAISAALIASIPGTFRASAPDPAGAGARPRMRALIGEGLRWLWAHRLLRTLAIALGIANGAGAAVFATYVLFAQEILLLDGLGFGLLLASGSVGGLLGSVVGPNVVARLRSGPTLTLTLATPIVGFAVTAATSNAFVVAACFVVISFTMVLWNVVTVTLRQTLIPDAILGRINSVYRFLGWGAMPIGTLLGGALVSAVERTATREAGLRSPFVAAALIYLLLLLLAAPRLRTRAIDDATAAATATATSTPAG
jgi:MFS family permease